MTNTYTAVAIGPVYKTLSLARKTRELWGISYLFSFIMRRLIEEISDKSKLCLPYHPEMLAKASGKGAGLFSDRLIFEGNTKAEIAGFEKVIISEISLKSNLPQSYLQNYIRIYAVTFNLPCSVSNESETNNNIVIITNKLLDTAELKEKYHSDISDIDWKAAIDGLNGRLFYREAFKGKDSNFKFPSIIEIATVDFKRQNKGSYNLLVKNILADQTEDEQAVFLNALKNNEDFGPVKVRPYHKYIAVVQADGDNIGKTIEKIGNKASNVRNFSTALFDFAIEAANRIKNFGGRPVYIGGDDLLFFSPVAVFNDESLQSIFKLIQNIDEAFTEKVLENSNLKHLYSVGGELENDKPSMSYGVSMTYSKFPLNEARDGAYRLLRKAKAIKDDKNKICFELHKHSGHRFGFIIDKKKKAKDASNSLSFDYFLALVSNIPLQDRLLSSIIYKLAPLHNLLNSIATDRARLNVFFNQEFALDAKEDWQRNDEEKATKAFIENISAFYHRLAIDFPSANLPLSGYEFEISTNNIDKLYSVLRFIKYLTDEEND